jgi:S-DNA-T family DNA segregation ATPase FtsK/SpoIIIE
LTAQTLPRWFMHTLQNTYKDQKETPFKQKKKFSLPKIAIDKRFQIAMGIFLQAITLFLFAAFASHLLHSQTDQSTIEAMRELGIKGSGKTIHNWLGLLGALAAYYSMFRWFGITAFLLLIPIYFIGQRLSQFPSKLHFSLYRLIILVLLITFWINVALGYASLLINTPDFFDQVLGGIGFELGLLFDGLMGWGTIIFLITVLLIFIIYFFNITSLQLFTHTSNPVLESPKIKKPLFNQTAVSKLPPDVVDTPELDDQEEAITVATHEMVFPITARPKIKPSPSPINKTLDLQVEKHTEPTEALIESIANYDPKLDLPSYKYPNTSLLTTHEPLKQEVSQEELEQNKDRIVQTLTDFKIAIASIKATIGPTVTLYEIVPEAGIKISRIKNLEDDIALSLSALGIRIIAPIPGKGTIGIEVPNKNREMVPFKDMLATDKFMKSNMDLPIILGKTIANEVMIGDLTRMPHLLIAGATGQGKSVGLNVLLTSLIYKKHPSQLKLVLVDPKKVELSLYTKLERHFLAKLPSSNEPIITETKKVVNTLNSLCLEMDLRYNLLKQAGVRNIKEYNEKFIRRSLNPENGHRFLPYIVLVIDEFADMMMTAGREVETPIARLAQLARAIGIHLVLATQRPSVNVITGIIKANFPVRISFRVSSRIDSRTILDTGGAEQLVGQGDMLVSMNSTLTRLQCPFLDTQEVEHICDYIGAQRGYESAYLLPAYEEEENAKAMLDLGEQDPLFEDAARLIVMHQQGSTSLIQRKLKLGYNRAGRLMDQLEAAGIVGAFEGSKAREVLVPDDHSLDALLKAQKD